VLFMLRGIARPLAHALTHLFSKDNQKDAGYVQQSYTDKNGETGTRVESTPPSVEMAELRDKQRRRALEEVVEAFVSDDTRAVLGCLILDSLRDRTDRIVIKVAEGKEFVDSLDTPILVQYLAGVKSANAEVLRPFTMAITEIQTSMGERLKAVVADLGPGLTSQPNTEESADAVKTQEAPAASP
jgi:hypothetical protein